MTFQHTYGYVTAFTSRTLSGLLKKVNVEDLGQKTSKHYKS